MGKKSKADQIPSDEGPDEEIADATAVREVDFPPEEYANRSDSDDDSSSSDDEEDDDLVLEGVVIRNPEVESSSDDDDLGSESEQEQQEAMKPGSTQGTGSGTDTNQHFKRPANNGNQKQSQKKKKKSKKESSNEPEIVNVDFTFCDMGEKFFHGIKTLIHASSPVYASQSSALSDLMIENIAVGTVIATEGDDEGNVYGFASVLNVTKSQEAPCLQHLKSLSLKHCPSQHKGELETVLSGKTNRPAGFLLHARMVNLPLEITEVLHQQLVVDMDWAVKNAQGGPEQRKALDFGAFVRLAPCYPGSGGGGGGGGSGSGSVVYKYFDDEVFASNSEFSFTFDAPKGFNQEERERCTVIVMTKSGHRASMKELGRLVNGR